MRWCVRSAGVKKKKNLWRALSFPLLLEKSELVFSSHSSISNDDVFSFGAETRSFSDLTRGHSYIRRGSR